MGHGEGEDEECRCGEDDSHFYTKMVNQDLAGYFTKFNADKSIKSIFVPFSGRTVDMKWFYNQGLAVTGCEIVEKAVKQFYEDHSMTPKVQELTSGDVQYKVFENDDGKMKMICGDLFKLPSEVLGKHDAVYELNAFQALKKADKDKYVAKLSDSLKPGGKLFSIFWTMDMAAMGGFHDHHSHLHPHHAPVMEKDNSHHGHHSHHHHHQGDHGHGDHGHSEHGHGEHGHSDHGHGDHGHGNHGHGEHGHGDHHHHDHGSGQDHHGGNFDDEPFEFTDEDRQLFDKYFNMTEVFNSNAKNAKDPKNQANAEPPGPEDWTACMDRQVFFGTVTSN